MKTIITLLLFSFVIPNYSQQPPGESQLEMAKDLFDSKEYEDGLMILDMAIGKENPSAMKYKGDLYYNGIGLDKSYPNALEWYMKAADLGNLAAMNEILQLYADELIEGKTPKDAIDYLIELFEKGHHNSSLPIGLAYLDGVGREQNKDSAFIWFEKGNELGDLGCRFMLGQLVLESDNQRGFTLLEDACMNDYFDACAYLGYIYFKGVSTEKNIDIALNI